MFKILIVEDEELIRKGLIYLPPWELLGCCIAGEASDGAEGLERIGQLQPDIVICDIRMPVMDGLEMLERSVEGYDFDAVLLSGYSDFEYAKKGICLGVKNYLQKPVDFDELSECIKKITSSRAEKQKKSIQLLQAQALLEKESIFPASERENRSSDCYTEQLMTLIAEKFDQKITLSDISHELGMSPSYLNGKLKDATGCTFNKYLNRYRIAKAIELLSGKQMMVYEVAEKVGFYDYKYFIKVFKKYVGCTPFQFITSIELNQTKP